MNEWRPAGWFQKLQGADAFNGTNEGLSHGPQLVLRGQDVAESASLGRYTHGWGNK